MKCAGYWYCWLAAFAGYRMLIYLFALIIAKAGRFSMGIMFIILMVLMYINVGIALQAIFIPPSLALIPVTLLIARIAVIPAVVAGLLFAAIMAV